MMICFHYWLVKHHLVEHQKDSNIIFEHQMDSNMFNLFYSNSKTQNICLNNQTSNILWTRGGTEPFRKFQKILQGKWLVARLEKNLRFLACGLAQLKRLLARLGPKSEIFGSSNPYYEHEHPILGFAQTDIDYRTLLYLSLTLLNLSEPFRPKDQKFSVMFLKAALYDDKCRFKWNL